MTYKGNKLSSISISDVMMNDYPDFSDAFVEEAFLDCEDRWLTEHELEEDCISDQTGEYILENLDLYN